MQDRGEVRYRRDLQESCASPETMYERVTSPIFEFLFDIFRRGSRVLARLLAGYDESHRHGPCCYLGQV